MSRECNASRYIISSNGAAVYDYISKKVIYKNTISKEKCQSLYDIAEHYKCIFSIHQGNVRIVNQEKYNDETEIVMGPDVMKKAKDVVQCVIMDKNLEKMKVVRNKILAIEGIRIINESKCLTNENENSNGTIYCDVVEKNTSKGRAINVLCNTLGINRNATIGIGDSYNDIEMLDFVGYSIAMGNSLDNLKQRVNEVTGINDLDGAAEVFERIIDEKPPFKKKEIFI